MTSKFDIKKYILEQVINGKIDKESAFTLIKHYEKNTNSKARDIAIIGMSCRFPDADNYNEFWQNILGGVNSVKPFPSERRKDTDIALSNALKREEDPYFKAGYLGEIDKFDAGFFRIPPREAVLMDPYQRKCLEVAYEAIEDAGYGGAINGTNTGVYIGADHSFRTVLPCYTRAVENPDILAMTGAWTGILSSRISYTLDLKGPGMVLDTACSSGLLAVHTACEALLSGDCEMAIAGGINLILFPTKNSLFDSVESSDSLVKTFDSNAKGTVWGEGVGVIMLKPLENAIRDKDNIHAVIKGSAINNDGMSNGITAPSAEAQEAVICKAWDNAGVNPETISYIEAHGTGTVLGDPIEINGLTRAFKKYTDKKQFCGIGTVKVNISHTVSASGLASIIKVVMSMKNKKIAPNINFSVPNPYINFVDSPLYMSDKLRAWDNSNYPCRAGVSAFGFSGTNCHVLLEESPCGNLDNTTEEDLNVLTISAKSEEALKEIVKKYISFMKRNKGIPISNFCYTTNIGRGHYNYRMAVVFSDKDNLLDRLENISLTSLEESFTQGDYYGYHKIVPLGAKEKKKGEISEGERIRLSKEAQEKIDNYINSGYTDINILGEICEYYIKGATIKWAKLYRSKRKKLNIPTYAFERKRHWINIPVSSMQASEIKPISKYFMPGWRQIDNSNKTSDIIKSKPTCVLIIKDERGLAQDVSVKLKEQGIKVIEVSISDAFTRKGEFEYTISNDYDSYKKLFEDIQGKDISHILHLPSLDNMLETGDLEQSLERGIYSLHKLAKAIGEMDKKKAIEMLLISQNTSMVTGEDTIVIPQNSMLFALGRTVSLENINLKIRCIDIDAEVSGKDVVKELELASDSFITAYRKGSLYIEELDSVNFDDIEQEGIDVRENGVYIITGGAGGLGLAISKYLASKAKIKLALINRTKLPKREEWESIMSQKNENKLYDKIRTIRELEKDGSEILCYSGDVSSLEDMNAVVDDLKSRFGKINGIIHCAGVSKKNLLVVKEKEELQEVLSPKVQGTIVLDNATSEENLDFFILFSSISSLLGFPGQGDYSAANAFMDAFAEQRGRKGKTMSIIWPAWSDAGMAANNNISLDGAFKALKSSEAVEIFEKLLGKKISKVVVGEINHNNPIGSILNRYAIKFSKNIISPDEKGLNNIQQNTKKMNDKKAVKYKIEGRKGKEYTEIENKLAQIWAFVLGVDTIDIYDSFYDLGGDSILASKLFKEIEEEFPDSIGVTDLFAYPSISQMAEHLSSKAVISKASEKASEFTVGENDEVNNRDEITRLISGVNTGNVSILDALDILDKVRLQHD